jgi:Ca-activated chloride channel family protein
LEAGGSTAGGQGIELAYRFARRNFSPEAVNRIILASDGDFNVGISDPARLGDLVARERSSGVFLTVLGFGGGNYNDAMMQKLAQLGNGMAAYIDDLDEAQRVLVDRMTSSLFVVAKDVKFQVEFNPARIREYRLIGYETRLLRREDFANDAVDAGDVGAGHSVTALYEMTPVGGAGGLVEPLRYSTPAPVAADPSAEFAHLRIRYKLPKEQSSRLIERPITDADKAASIDAAGEDMRFAASVAGFGQLLRDDPYLRQPFGYDRVGQLAKGATKGDPLRLAFVRIVESAARARKLGTEGRPQR